MKAYSFYDAATGEFLTSSFSGSPEALAVNTRPGCVAIEGRFSPNSHRFDLATGKVVAHTPPKPADTEFFTHVWDDDLRQWTARQTKAGRTAQHDELLKVRMLQAEANQGRAVRDIVLALAAGKNPPQAALGALQDVESTVRTLRDGLGREPT